MGEFCHSDTVGFTCPHMGGFTSSDTVETNRKEEETALILFLILLSYFIMACLNNLHKEMCGEKMYESPKNAVLKILGFHNVMTSFVNDKND